MADTSLRATILGGASLEQVVDTLDGTDHAGRMNLLYGLDRKAMATLYRLAEAAPALTPEFFVGDRDPLDPVPHYGWNSVPVPGPWRKFAKVMCRPSDGSNRLFGYNEYRSKGWLGPGYFCLVPTANNPTWAPRGAWVVDYFQVPDDAVPGHWPQIQSNMAGLSRFVYGGTRDYLRRVSQHVSVGRPFKGDTDEKEMDFSFVLCRG